MRRKEHDKAHAIEQETQNWRIWWSKISHSLLMYSL